MSEFSQLNLTLGHLSVRYGSRTVLHDLSLQVQPGMVLGIIGPNGAGKSTLLRALSGIIPLAEGNLTYGGVDLSHLNPMERARRLAVVPQARQLPPAFTAWETVLLGRTPHLNWLGQISGSDEDIVLRAMERTDTLRLAERRVGELSGGEQQRLLLARALAQEAPVMLLDEPTTHLDLHHQLSLLHQVRDLVHSQAEPPHMALVVLHDLNLVSQFADQVALLVEGRLRALGTPGEVMQPELLSEVYHVPLQVIAHTQNGQPIILPNLF